MKKLILLLMVTGIIGCGKAHKESTVCNTHIPAILSKLVVGDNLSRYKVIERLFDVTEPSIHISNDGVFNASYMFRQYNSTTSFLCYYYIIDVNYNKEVINIINTEGE